jgi:hypothetical protein
MGLIFLFASTAQVKVAKIKFRLRKNDEVYFPFVKAKALQVMKYGFNAVTVIGKCGLEIMISLSNLLRK